jgi:hypothetical protein
MTRIYASARQSADADGIHTAMVRPARSATLEGANQTKEPRMPVDHERIGWLEAEVRMLRARLEEAESSFESAEWQKKARADAAENKAARAVEEATLEVRRTHEAVRELRNDTINAFANLTWKVNAHTITVWALGFVSFVEAGLIAWVWVRM